MELELAITTFGLKDARGRRMREASLREIGAGEVAALFIAAGDPGSRPFRFTIEGPRGRHAGPVQQPQTYDNAGVLTVLLETGLSPTAVPVAGRYRLALEQMQEDGTGRELHATVFHVR